MNTADGKNRPIVFHISTAAIFKLLFVFLAIVFLYMVREVVAIIFAALIFSLAFDPWINRIQSYRVPRALAIVSVYLVLIAAFTVSIMLLIPPLTQ